MTFAPFAPVEPFCSITRTLPFTVLKCAVWRGCTANVVFVSFRALARRRTFFRPPWYHMNIMSEFMGLILANMTPKAEGFAPGGIRSTIACCRMGQTGKLRQSELPVI